MLALPQPNTAMTYATAAQQSMNPKHAEVVVRGQLSDQQLLLFFDKNTGATRFAGHRANQKGTCCQSKHCTQTNEHRQSRQTRRHHFHSCQKTPIQQHCPLTQLSQHSKLASKIINSEGIPYCLQLLSQHPKQAVSHNC